MLDTVKLVEKVFIEFMNNEVDAREEKGLGVKDYWRALQNYHIEEIVQHNSNQLVRIANM